MTAFAELDELKARLGHITKTTEDPFLQDLLDEHALIAERYTGRTFAPNPPLNTATGADDAPDVTVTIDAGYRGIVHLPDARSVSAITIDGNPLVSQDFRLVGDGRAYHDVILQPLAGITPGFVRAGWQAGWAVGRTMTVTGRFGIWPIPADIKGAVLLMAARAYKEKDARYSDAVELPDGGAVHYWKQFPPRAQMVLDSYAIPLVA